MLLRILEGDIVLGQARLALPILQQYEADLPFQLDSIQSHITYQIKTRKDYLTNKKRRKGNQEVPYRKEDARGQRREFPVGRRERERERKVDEGFSRYRYRGRESSLDVPRPSLVQSGLVDLGAARSRFLLTRVAVLRSMLSLFYAPCYQMCQTSELWVSPHEFGPGLAQNGLQCLQVIEDYQKQYNDIKGRNAAVHPDYLQDSSPAHMTRLACTLIQGVMHSGPVADRIQQDIRHLEGSLQRIARYGLLNRQIRLVTGEKWNALLLLVRRFQTNDKEMLGLRDWFVT